MTTIYSTRANGSRRVALKCDEKTRTKQQFKAECDINNILAKFRKTGALEHVRKHGPQYGFAGGVEFAEAMRVVAQGKTQYEELPSHIKKNFGSPEAFLDFVHDENNADEVRKMFGEAPLPAEPEAGRPTDEPAGESSGEAASPPSTEAD